MRAAHHLAVAAVLILAACHQTDVAPPAPATAPGGQSARFYAALAPYGTWLDDATYGWVWLPSPAIVGADFFPYLTGGDWVYTDAGWMFSSSYPWGWAPFHYGRWAFDAGIGWMWVPGDVWGPAWVDWRWNDGYVGWAPLPPRVERVSNEDLRSHWVVVPAHDLTRPRLEGHVQPIERAQAVFAEGSVHPEAHPGWRAGPPGDLIAAATGQPLTPVHLTHPATGQLVRSHVEGGAVHHTPFVEPKRPPPPASFPHNPPKFPVHTMHPHTTPAPVFDVPHYRGAFGGGPSRGFRSRRGERLL